MTLKQGTLFGMIGAIIKLVTILLNKMWELFYESTAMEYSRFEAYEKYKGMMDNIATLTTILDILAYIAFGLFFFILYKKQK